MGRGSGMHPSGTVWRQVAPILLTAALLLLVLPAVAAAAPQPVLAPVNPDYAEAVAKRAFVRPSYEPRTDILRLGALPDPVLTHKGPQTHRVVRDELPAAYDLRDHNKLTAVRDQAPYGTCWAFATMGVLESYLMPRQRTDFSEDNLVNYAGFDTGDPYEHGGNYTMSLAYLLRRSGPKWEQADVYGTPEYTRNAKTQKWIGGAYLLPPLDDPELVELAKSLIMEVGAVGTMMYWDEEDTRYDPAYASYYYDGEPNVNHAVCIVGWDDGFPRTSFLAGNQPSEDGAWLIRNSWGTSFGDGGYFWISYSDTALGCGNNLVLDRVGNPRQGTRLYGHDRLGYTGEMGFAANVASDTAWMASRYRATRRERVTGVGFYMTSGGKATVYVGRTKRTLRRVGTANLYLPGYYTVDLRKKLKLKKGQRFVVAVKVRTPGYEFPIALQSPTDIAVCKATSGMSWVSPDGRRWTDATRLDEGTAVCLKAITRR